MVTIRDIADAAGVSAATISKVMSRSQEMARINPATIRRVRQIAQKMGYRPNQHARALVRQKSQTIGVYVAPHPGDRINSLYVTPILEGICQAAREVHYDVLLIDYGISDLELHRSLEKFLTKRVDGVILIYFQGSDRVIDSALAAGMPMVAINNFDMLPLSSVNLDNFAGIGMVVQYLHGLGHRKIAFLGEMSDQPMKDHVLRKEAFTAAAKRFQIEKESTVVSWPQVDLRVEREGPFCQEDGYRGVDWLIRQGRAFTAVVCYNDLVAMGALRRLGEAELKVPEDISVIGFDNTFVSAYLAPPLSTVEHPIRQMGTQAFQILLETLDKRSAGSAMKTLMLKPELVVRQSTGAVRR
jgi:DNA-binding LacI/PurR family transcriptional regulator